MGLHMSMLEKIMQFPWTSLGFLFAVASLYAAAAIRTRRDKQRQGRALSDRREQPRGDPDRRWEKRKRLSNK